VHLAQHLDLPIGERNRLLLAGGFAPPYLELPYDGEVMQPLRESLERLLGAHEPNPALIVLVASPSTVPEEGPRVEYLACKAGRPYPPGNGTGWTPR
jgi:hypothetical protein